MEEDSRIYFARRAAEEQERAEQASDPIVAKVHRRLQRVYVERASIGERWQGPDGSVDVNLGSKGIVELELVASGEKWGRGPKKDVHSSNRARLDSPAFRLVQDWSATGVVQRPELVIGFPRAGAPQVIGGP